MAGSVQKDIFLIRTYILCLCLLLIDMFRWSYPSICQKPPSLSNPFFCLSVLIYPRLPCILVLSVLYMQDGTRGWRMSVSPTAGFIWGHPSDNFGTESVHAAAIRHRGIQSQAFSQRLHGWMPVSLLSAHIKVNVASLVYQNCDQASTHLCRFLDNFLQFINRSL